MEIILTNDKLVELIRSATRRLDGLLILDIPEIKAHQKAAQLEFWDDSKTIEWGGHTARLSSRQYALLDLVFRLKYATFEHVQDKVWGKPISDATIRKECSRLSARLLNAKVPLAIATRHGLVILEGF